MEEDDWGRDGWGRGEPHCKNGKQWKEERKYCWKVSDRGLEEPEKRNGWQIERHLQELSNYSLYWIQILIVPIGICRPRSKCVNQDYGKLPSFASNWRFHTLSGGTVSKSRENNCNGRTGICVNRKVINQKKSINLLNLAKRASQTSWVSSPSLWFVSSHGSMHWCWSKHASPMSLTLCRLLATGFVKSNQ